jgi:hypothetical protein
VAVSVEAAFVLLDRASGPLKEIRRQALLTDKAMRSLDTSGGGGGGGTKLLSFRQEMEKSRNVARSMGNETEAAGKKVEKAGNIFTRAEKAIKNWTRSLGDAHPALKGVSAGVGAVIGGLTGMVNKVTLIGGAVVTLIPILITLTGVVGALASSLAFAVGGGALLGGGLLGSFAVGLGSLAVIAKPALDGLKKYQAAVTNLNKAMASGSPTQIKARQKQLDALAKANPGVAQLARNLSGFEKQWKKMTAPARASFFKLAADGISTLRDLLPTLADQVNKNVGAIQQGFHQILEPFLKSDQFKGFIDTLGEIFRRNLPGFMKGFVAILGGLANVLKILAPTLDKAGGAFERMGKSFEKWTTSKGGKSTVSNMVDAFKEWWRLVKGIARIIGDVVGVAGPKGTGLITKWADATNRLADRLSKPGGKKGISDFFTKSIDDAGKLWPLLKNIADDLKDIYAVFKPLGSVTAFVLKTLPAPAVAALTAAVVGGKGIVGAVKGAKGVLDFFTKTRGSTPANPLFVADVTGGLGGGGGKHFRGKRLPGKVPAEGAEVGGAVEDASQLSRAGRLRRALGRPGRWIAGGIRGLPMAGAAVAGVTAFSAMSKADNNARDKLIAGLKGADPTAPILNLIGLPSVTELLFPGANDKGRLSAARVASGLPEALGGTQFNRGRTRAIPHTTGPILTQPPRGYESNPLIGFGALGLHPTPSGGQGGGFFSTIANAITGAGVSSRNYLQNVGTAVATFANNLPHKLNKPISDATKQGAADIGTFKQKSLDSLSTLNTKGTSQMQGLTTNMGTETGKEKTTVTGLQTAVTTGITNIVGNVNTVMHALGIGKIVGGDFKKLGATAGGAIASVGAKVAGHASGGRLPGPARGDHIPLLGRGGGLLGIADGGELVVNRHTERRIDQKLASFGTTLGREVSNETIPHAKTVFSYGGRVPRLATGGRLSYGQLEGLWTQAGGPAGAASLMAAIALAESGGNPSIVNSIGASGLWQIHPAEPGDLNPLTNAQIAVRKFHSQGLAAWQAYTNGAYRRFLQGGVPASAYAGGGGAAFAMPNIPTPALRGPPGALTGLGQGIMRQVAAGANQFLARQSPGGGAVPGGQGVVQDPSGKPVAGWIEPILNWARGHGWHGTVTSGYRSYAQQAALYGHVFPAARPGTSNHEGTVFPRGAVDVSDAAGLSAVLSRSPYASTLVWAGSKDPVHFSHPHGGSYELGGRVPWFAGGADFVARRPQIIGVGDRPGGERVTVTPTGQSTRGGGVHVEIHHIEVNRKGDIQRIVDEEMRLLADSLERQT